MRLVSKSEVGPDAIRQVAARDNLINARVKLLTIDYDTRWYFDRFKLLGHLEFFFVRSEKLFL